MEQVTPKPLEEYVPGVANGLHYMAKLSGFAEGPWSIEVIHVEGMAPLNDSDRTWSTRAEAMKAVDQLVTAIAH